jgi:hypothetical protein
MWFGARAPCRAAPTPYIPAAMLPFIPAATPDLVDEPPAGDDWLQQIKHDGYRTLAVLGFEPISPAIHRHTS